MLLGAIIKVQSNKKGDMRMTDMTMGQRIAVRRKLKNMSQEALAEQLQVSRQAISKWESGRGYPNIDSLRAIAKFFSVTVDDLLSSDEVLIIAEADSKQKEKYFYHI